MKKFLIIMVALFVSFAFVTGVMAEKAAKPMKAKGSVITYEAGKTLTVKVSKKTDLTFDITADAKVQGDVKEGGRVSVIYNKEGDKNIATSITAMEKKAKKAKKK